MRLSDIMSATHLSSYAEIALAIFSIVFIAIAAHVLRARERETWDRARYLPLDGEPELIRVARRSGRGDDAR